MQEAIENDCIKNKFVADFDALQWFVHLWQHEISGTESWRKIHLTTPSRKTVLVESFLGYPVPKISMARYPHRRKMSFCFAVRNICLFVLFLFVRVAIQTDHNIPVKEHYGKQILGGPQSWTKFLTFYPGIHLILLSLTDLTICAVLITSDHLKQIFSLIFISSLHDSNTILVKSYFRLSSKCWNQFLIIRSSILRRI